MELEKVENQLQTEVKKSLKESLSKLEAMEELNTNRKLRGWPKRNLVSRAASQTQAMQQLIWSEISLVN